MSEEVTDHASRITHHSSLDRLSHHLFDGGHSLSYLLQPALPEREHSFLDRLPAQFEAGRSHEDQLSEVVGYLHDFIETDSSLVAGAVARRTPDSLEGPDLLGYGSGKPDVDQRLGRRGEVGLALLAYLSHEPLRLDQVYRSSNQERLYTHVHQPAYRRRRVVGVQRRQHQVS